jgi:hypothetical protein
MNVIYLRINVVVVQFLGILIYGRVALPTLFEEEIARDCTPLKAAVSLLKRIQVDGGCHGT